MISFLNFSERKIMFFEIFRQFAQWRLVYVPAQPGANRSDFHVYQIYYLKTLIERSFEFRSTISSTKVGYFLMIALSILNAFIVYKDKHSGMTPESLIALAGGIYGGAEQIGLVKSISVDNI